jgi:hypothetical protein
LDIIANFRDQDEGEEGGDLRKFKLKCFGMREKKNVEEL